MIDAALPSAPRHEQSEPTAALAVQLDRSERRISVRGELDMATVPVLAQVMARLLDLNPGGDIIDLSGVTFIDAAGLGCLVGHAAQVAALGAKISVVGVSPRVRRVFDIVGLDELLEPSPPCSGRRSADQQ